MAMSWVFLMVVFAALCGLAAVMGVLVMIFRAATRSTGQRSEPGRAPDDSHLMVPPVMAGDSLMNLQTHQPGSFAEDPTRHHAADMGASASFDSGAAASAPSDAGGAAGGSDSGSGCG